MQANENKNEEIIQRILQFIKYLDISESKFSTKMGKNRSFFAQMKQRSGFNIDTLIEIGSFYDQLNLDWVIKGRGEMIYNTISNSQVNEEKADYNTIKKDMIEVPTATFEAMKFAIESQKELISQLIEKTKT